MTTLALTPNKTDSSSPQKSRKELSTIINKSLSNSKQKSHRSSILLISLVVAVSSLIVAYQQMCRESKSQFCSFSPSIFYRLSYAVKGAQYSAKASIVESLWQSTYGKGPLDACFVAGWICILASIQYIWMQVMVNYIAPVLITKKSDSKGLVADRFAEQSFQGFYYTCSAVAGIYIWGRSPYFPLSDAEFWTDYPTGVDNVNGIIKSYYLIVAAFWIQQFLNLTLVVAKKERRGDHYAMVSHHVVTTMLVCGSYISHLTRVGNAVMVVMDLADIFLCTAKCLKYMGRRFQFVCDATFGMFVVVWLFTRHGLYIWLMRSVWNFANELEQREEPKFEREVLSGLTITPGGLRFFFSCLFALQILIVYWFFMIMRVVLKVIRGSGAGDVREEEDD